MEPPQIGVASHPEHGDDLPVFPVSDAAVDRVALFVIGEPGHGPRPMGNLAGLIEAGYLIRWFPTPPRTWARPE